jgi:hypothetical protein
MAAEDVFVVRSGPKIEKLEIRPPREELKHGREGTSIGYVGVIGQQEGLDLLVAAAEHLIRGWGVGTCISALSAAARPLRRCRPRWRRRGSTRYFTFTGRAPDDLLLDMLNTADVCVNPTGRRR